MASPTASSLLNTTNSTKSPIFIGITMIERWVQLVSLGFLVGVVSAGGNALSAIGIIRSKTLRSRFYAVLCYMLAWRAIGQPVTQFPSVTCGVLRTLNMMDINMKAVYCYMLGFLTTFTSALDLALLLIMTVDRTLAIVRPTFYCHLTIKQAVQVCILVNVIIVIIKVIPSLIGIQFDRVIVCTGLFSAVTPMFNIYSQTVDIAIWVLIIVNYIGLALYVRFGLMSKQEPNSEDSVAMIAFKRQALLLLMLQRLIFMHLGMMVISRVLLWLFPLFPSQASHLLALAGIAGSIECVANMIVPLVMDKDLREATLPCFYRQVTTSAVIPLGPQRPAAKSARGGRNARNQI